LFAKAERLPRSGTGLLGLSPREQRRRRL